MQLIGDARPYNVNPMEWAYQRQNELGYRYSGLAASAGTQFTGDLSTAGIVAAGMKIPAISRFAGKSALRGLGVGALGFTGVGMALDPIVSTVQDEAERHLRDTSGIQRMSTRFGSEFSRSQAAMTSRSISNFGYKESLSHSSFDTKLGEDGYRNVLFQGLQSSLFHGKTPEELIKQTESAAKVVKFLTGIMGSRDVNETMQAITQFKGMGVNLLHSGNYAERLGRDSFKYGSLMGIPGAELLRQATTHGSEVAGSYGMPSFTGVLPMMKNMALAHEMEKRGRLSAAEISVGGGHLGIAKSMQEFISQMMVSPQIGGVMMASSMTGGQFDPSKFGANADQGYFGMMGKGAQFMADPSKAAEYFANKDNWMASLGEAGDGQSGMLKVLRKAMDNMPYLKGMNVKDRANMMAAFLKQQQPGLSDAAAKALVTRLQRPGIDGQVDREADWHESRGLYNQVQERNTLFRPFTRAMESIERIPSRLKRPGQVLGQSIAETALDVFGIPEFGRNDAFGAAELTGDNIGDLYNMNSRRTRRDNGDPLSGEQLNYAYGVNDRAYGFYNSRGQGTPFWGDRRAKEYVPQAMYAQVRENASYYNALNRKDGTTAAEMFASNKDLFGSATFDQIAGSYQNFVEDNGAGLFKEGIAKPGMEFMYQRLKQHNGDQFSSAYDSLYGSSSASNVRSAFGEGGSMRGVLDSHVSDLKAGGLGINQAALTTHVLDLLQSDPQLQEHQRRSGLSNYQYATQVVAGATGKSGLLGTSQDINLLSNSDQIVNAGAKLEQEFGGDPTSIFMSMLGKSNGFNLNTTARNLSDIGITDELMNDLGKTSGDTEAFQKAFDAAMSGDMSGVKGIKSKAARQYLSSTFADQKQLGRIKSKFGESGITDSIDSIRRLKMGRASDDLFEEIFAGSGKEISGRLASGDTQGMLNSILAYDSRNDEYAQEIQGVTRNVKGMGGDRARLSKLAEQYGLDTSKTSGMSIDKLESAIVSSATAGLGSGKMQQKEQSELDGKDLRRAIADLGGGKSALYIIDVTKSGGQKAASDLETKVKESTAKENPIESSKGSGGFFASISNFFSNGLSASPNTDSSDVRGNTTSSRTAWNRR
jgi:hypothetical protein